MELDNIPGKEIAYEDLPRYRVNRLENGKFTIMMKCEVMGIKGFTYLNARTPVKAGYMEDIYEFPEDTDAILPAEFSTRANAVAVIARRMKKDKDKIND